MNEKEIIVKKYRRLFLLVFLPALFVLSQTRDIYQRPEHFERSRDFDALHYKLKFTFDLEKKTFYGENTITLSSLKDGLRRIALDAMDFTVTGVADPNGASLKFEKTPRQLFIDLAKSLDYGEKAAFTVKYFRQEPKTGFKFMAETPDSPAQINTYNWPEDARRWIPCFDYPNDKVTSELVATVKSDWNVLSNGRLVEVIEDKSAGTKTFHWLQDKPHPTYNIMMAAGPYEVLQDKLGDLPVDYWVYKKDVPDAPRSFQKTPKMIDFFNKTFGYAYPWAKYDQVCVSGSGGGMEATTATILGQSTIHDARAEQDFSSDGLVAHELAHQWWGDLVTERDWADVWISESFATYSEYLWTRFDKGEDEGALNLLDKKNSYLREARTRYMRPIVFNRYNNPWDIMDSHSYPKGAAILHMMRFILGDKPFFRALGLFLNKHAFESVDTHDFMTAVKETTGENMDWFFEQWIYKPGHPVFDVSCAWDEAARKSRLTVVQSQDTSKGVPIYKTPVVIGIVTAEKSASEKIWITKKEETFDLAAAQKPLLVKFDEGHFLLKEWTFAKTREELIYQLGNDDALGRLWAAAELAAHLGPPDTVRALMERAKSDPFWAVRRGALETLVKGSKPELVAFLRERCSDANSRVRTAALRALGDYKDRRLVEFFEECFLKDSSYVAQAEALAAIGKCGDKSAADFLKKAAAMPSPRGMLKRNAEAALKMIEGSGEKKK
jgi:aminopeptidase N